MYVVKLKNVHCSVIIGRNPKEANSNTSEIQQQGNPVAYTGNCFTLWPILGIPLAPIGKLPFIGKYPV